MAVVMTVIVIVVMVMTMIRATFRRASQQAAQIAGDKGLDRRAGWPRTHFDALFRKKIQRAPSNPADNDAGDPLLMQPARKQSGLVLWG